MKTFFRNNSYTLILIALSFIFLFVFAEKVQQDSEVEYLEVKVGEGDSLLTIADKYYICHRMSYEEFADWVKRENGLADGRVHAGETLVIPVEKWRIPENQIVTVQNPGTEFTSFTKAESGRN